jgi:UDP-glucose 4-epimerase
MKSILVTGGAGFLGAHLVNRLIGEGIKVVIVDILRSTGGISYIHPNAIFLNYNICDENLYKELDKFKFDAVFHLAAQSAGEPSYADPYFDIQTNAYGTCLISKYCYEREISRLIYTSTVAIYGSVDGEIKESFPVSPDSVYGVSKYSGELFVQQWLNKSKTQYTIFRVYNTYGPGENLNYQKKGMVSIYASFIWKNEPLLIKGSLDRYRDFTYIDDNIDILFQSLDEPKSFNNIYNLSTGNKTVIRDLLGMMLDAALKPKNYKVQVSNSTPGDSFGTHASIEKLRKDFQWDPKINLKEGLKKYFSWINQLPVTDDLKGYHPLEM